MANNTKQGGEKKEKVNITDIVPKTDNGTELTLVPTWIQSKQIMVMLQRTPSQHIYKRKAKGGGDWDYVTGIYVKKVLNYAFGFNWDFEVVEHGKEENHIWVLGKLTVKGFDNKTKSEGRISKMQFGRSEVKMKKTGGMLDFGNDLKAACTDALKKCASEFGIASDIYGKNEFKDIGKEVVGNGDSKPVITSDNGYIEKLRKFAKDNGADTDAKAIILINGLTGLKLIDFPKSQTHAQRTLANCLQAKQDDTTN